MTDIIRNPNLCLHCGVCEDVCEKKALNFRGEMIDPDKCINCGKCIIVCPKRALNFKSNKWTTLLPSVTKKEKRGGKTVRRPERSGRILLSGNEAVAQAAFDAGCRFFAGYPITPSSEIMNSMIRLNNEPGGTFIQMEDEIASIMAIIGASWAGKKSMTATSGPGFSLMQESLGYAVATETPLVLVDVMRAGPSTGQATRPAQADMMQAIWGSHADAPRIVLMPSSFQECYDLTVEAFNLAEEYRSPVIVLIDEILAHTKSVITIPDKIDTIDRWYCFVEKPFGPPLDKSKKAASMPAYGDGYYLRVTGSTHNNDGVRAAADPDAQQLMNDHLCEKIEKVDALYDFHLSPHRFKANDIIIATGISALSAQVAVRQLNEQGFNVDLLVIKTLWPFPFAGLKKLLNSYTRTIIVEMNQGQLFHQIDKIHFNPFSLTQNTGLAIKPGRIIDFYRNIISNR